MELGRKGTLCLIRSKVGLGARKGEGENDRVSRREIVLGVDCVLLQLGKQGLIVNL
jgi:hypothetical protein